MPTLIIHGTGDKTVKIDATGRAAAAGIPGSTLLEYDGAPHGLFASHKDRFIADVLNFVKTTNYQPSVTGRGSVLKPRVTTSQVV